MTVEFSDNFNRPNSGSLGADWTEIGSTFGIDDNTALQSSGLNANHFVRTTDEVVSSVDHYSEVTVVSSGAGAGPIVRSTPATETSNFTAYYSRWISSQWVIYRAENGTFLSIAYASAPSDPYPYRMRLEAEGTSLRLFVDDIEVLTTTDSVVTSGHRVGMFTRRDGRLDDFEAGTFGAGPVGPFLRTTGGYLRTGAGILRPA